MIKIFFIPVFLFLTIITSAQQGTASPYSFYGIGDVRFKGTAENRLMGGVSVFPDSIHVNIQNPASYSSLKLTTFTVGGVVNIEELQTYNKNEKAQRTSLDYLAIALPFGNSGVAMGLIPYTSVGYKIKTTDEAGIIRNYEGNGGLNKVFVGYSYKLFPNFNIGADVNYNFGNIETLNNYYKPGIQFGSQELNNSELSGFNINIGAMYQKKINKKLDFYGSLTIAPQNNLKSKNTRTIGTILYTDVNLATNIDQFDPINSENIIKTPTMFSVGLGIGQNKKWMIGTEVTLKQFNNFDNRFSDVNNATFENAIKYSLGGYYIPNYNSFSNYFKKITYRAGMRYENTGLVINNKSINDYSFSGGFSLPLGSVFSNLNLGVEYGKRGTALANLVLEKYTNIIVSLSLNDKWFVKRKFD